MQQNFYFVDGPNGTEKTFLYNKLLAKVQCKGDIALLGASSGIGALLLQEGQTTYS
jgi:hypothetical protein